MAGRRRTTVTEASHAEAVELPTVNVKVTGDEPGLEVVAPPLPVVNVKVDAEAEEPTGEGTTEQE